MCKIIIEEENTEIRDQLRDRLASMFPEHDVVEATSYKTKVHKRLESAVGEFIETVGSAIEERLNKSMSV